MLTRYVPFASIFVWAIVWIGTGQTSIPTLPPGISSGTSITAHMRADCTPTTRSLPVTVVSVGGSDIGGPESVVVGLECETTIPAFSTVSFVGSLRPDDGTSRIRYVIFPRSAPSIVQGPPAVIAWAGELRQSFREAAARMPGEGGQLLPGLVVGDTSLVSEDLARSMKITSLTHLMAVSGANCAIVVGLVYGLTALMGAPRIIRVVLSLTALAGFVCIVTPQPSVVRASIMTMIGLVAVGLGRVTSGVHVLSAAVIVSLAIDPWLAREFGFVLSVAATASLLLLARPIATRIPARIPRPIALALSVPIAAAVGCQPIIMMLSPALPLYGVITNVLAAPLAPMATVIGMVAAVTSFVPLVGSVVTGMAWLPAAVIAVIARVFSALPGSSIPWPSGVVGVLTALLMSVGFVIALRRFRRGFAIWSIGLVVGASITMGTALTSRLTVPTEWSIAQCDVGQGDAMLYRVGGQILLIDTGLEPEPIQRCLDVMRVTTIDVLILTHFDADHSGAATSLNRPIGLVIHGPVVDETDRRLLLTLESAGAQLQQVWAGDTVAFGSERIEVLWPFRDIATEPSNPSSLVTVLIPRACGSCLSFMNLGDLPAPEQRGMAERSRIPSVDVIKVSHHGSRDNEPSTYLSARASVALVGVGADNTYGHPTDEALAMFEAAGSKVLRSDHRGTVILSRESEQIRLWSERLPDS